jgi:hypothetical protein
LTALLLLILTMVHYLNDNVASFYAPAEQVAAAKAWEYILTNAGFCLVLGVCGLLARKPLAWPAIAWGMVELGERSACRLARPIGGEPPEVPLFSGLCGVETYWLGVFAACCLAVAMLDKWRKT